MTAAERTRQEPLSLLMALRVKGRAGPTALASATGLCAAEIEGVLARGRRDGIVSDSAAGWALTDRGRTTLAERLATEPINRAGLTALYQRFLALDAELKAAITAWQLAAPAAAGVRERSGVTQDLVAAGEAAVTVAGELAVAVPRLRPYAARLETAVRAVAGGAAPFVASPRVDSLHQVWFELHEDLLATLGRSRAS